MACWFYDFEKSYFDKVQSFIFVKNNDMITPQDFPYISAIHVGDCYTYQDFDITLAKHQPFSHLILTGKNGSGKSTVLRNIDVHIKSALGGKDLNQETINIANALKRSIEGNTNLEHYNNWQIQIKTNQRITPSFINAVQPTFTIHRKEILYSYLLPYRNSKVNAVQTPTKQEEFEKQLEQQTTSSDYFIKNFKQFLVNKKVNQAFAQLDNNQSEITETEIFFRHIEDVFAKIFEDKNLKLVFVKEAYEFFIKLSDGRELTFDVLPDGFSAFLSILMDLFLRLDLIRKTVGNNSYNPCGIVLIDEPETHLHLSLQYQVLPILTMLFPNIQFIVATHSPAVISSIKHVTIFDITTKETLLDQAIGKSFSELMVSHFGLDNEFSDFTDALFDKVNAILSQNKDNPSARNVAIKQILTENEPFISTSMRFELESILSEMH